MSKGEFESVTRWGHRPGKINLSPSPSPKGEGRKQEAIPGKVFP